MNKFTNIINYLWNLKDVIKIGFLTNYIKIPLAEQRFLMQKGLSHDYVHDFEEEISKEFGVGKTLAFASGRMAFYAVLKALSVGVGDEVIMTGFSCSVMANAILRTGATPVYVDIDKETLGTSPTDLIRKITCRTKVVVAQHTFGIPCKIDQILDICNKNHLYLIEDCALSLGSSYKGIKLGDWGDATIFSTDHSKPLNSLIGGGLYTKDKKIFEKVQCIQKSAGNLSFEQIDSILRSYFKEVDDQSKNKLFLLLSCYFYALQGLIYKVFKKTTIERFDLKCDFTSSISQNSHYPYPAKMPPQLAYLALRSLNDYKANIQNRKAFAETIFSIVSREERIPEMFNNPDSDIVPLRVPFLLKVKSKSDYSFLNTNWIWFQRPIVATSEPLINFGYQEKSCPVSEEVGKSIMNIPIFYDEKMQKSILNRLRRIYIR